MGTIDTDTLNVAIYGLGTVGALTIVRVLVTWLKSLLLISGQAARWLTTGVSAYVVAMMFAAAYYPPAAIVMGALFLVATLATTADALYAQEQRGKRE